MKNMNQKLTALRSTELREHLSRICTLEGEAVLQEYGTAADGLTWEQAEAAREQYGTNVLPSAGREPVIRRLLSAFLNPFTAILLALAALSAVTDILAAPPGERSCLTVWMIAAMVIVSGALRFVQEARSGAVTERLMGMLHTTAWVERAGEKRQLPLEELAAGDLVYLSAGDMIPADLRILQAKDLFVSQSALTGESEPVEKRGGAAAPGEALTDTENLAFLGSSVVSGSGLAVVVAVGSGTMLGAAAEALNAPPPKTAFEEGVGAVSWVLIRFMLLMAPAVLVISGLTTGEWIQAGLFALSVAVGLTPEMLPMIVTTSLAGGAMALSRQKVVVKQLDAIQNLGSMDILCTDKTGTLTQDRVALEYHLNVDGREDDRVLRHAFLNSYFQTGLKNLVDAAVIERQERLGAEALIRRYTKVDEIPFDFERRRMSVVVRDQQGKTQLVTKGAVEEMLRCCAWAECGGELRPLSPQVRRLVLEQSEGLNRKGMRVIAVAQKTNPAPAGQFSVSDEADMVLIGFLAFLDPPKETAPAAIRALLEHGVSVKILTGDNEAVARAVCQQVGLDGEKLLPGARVDGLDDRELGALAEKTTVFAKLSPAQKARIVRVLRERGHSVGFLGDGINDAAAMKAADVGISVDTAVDIAKETAQVVLLEKDLMVLERGVAEGRRTYANMIKYIKITASSNFGNVLSVLAASALLPFLPMASIQLILLNLIYDLSCAAMSRDNVDPDYLKRPRRWDASGISRFMLQIGPASSVFDLAVFLVMYFVLCPALTGEQLYSQLNDPALRAQYIALFQTGWFVESMWSQTLVIHMLRTPKLPFVHSRASAPVTLLSLLGVCLVTAIPYTPLGPALGLCPLPGVYFLWLTAFVCGYMALATAIKGRYLRRYGELL